MKLSKTEANTLFKDVYFYCRKRAGYIKRVTGKEFDEALQQLLIVAWKACIAEYPKGTDIGKKVRVHIFYYTYRVITNMINRKEDVPYAKVSVRFPTKNFTSVTNIDNEEFTEMGQEGNPVEEDFYKKQFWAIAKSVTDKESPLQKRIWAKKLEGYSLYEIGLTENLGKAMVGYYLNRLRKKIQEKYGTPLKELYSLMDRDHA